MLVIPVPGQSSWCSPCLPSTAPAAASFASVGAPERAAGGAPAGAAASADTSDSQARQNAVAEALAGMVHPIAPADSLPAVVHVYCARDARDIGSRPWRVGQHVDILGIYTLDTEDGEGGSDADADMAVDEAVEAGSSPARRKRRATAGPGAGAESEGQRQADGRGAGASSMPRTEEQEMDEFCWAADQARNPPSSLAVRLHAVLMRKVSVGEPALRLAQVQVGQHTPFAYHSPARAYVTIPAPAREAGAAPISAAKEVALEASRAEVAVRAGQGIAARDALQQVATALAAVPGLIAAPAPVPAGTSIAFLRDGIVSILSSCLGGDRLAGELTLLWALGGTSTYGRTDSLGLPLGRLSLSLVGLPLAPAACRMAAGRAAPPAARAREPEEEVPPLPTDAYEPPTPVRTGASPAAQRLAAVLESMAPALACLPLRLDLLNGRRWAPVQDHDTQRILPGLLQLAPGTLAVLDETVLGEGRLEAQGIKAIDAAQSVAGAGELPYDFGFGNVSRFPVDIPILSLCPHSASGRGLLRTDVSLPLTPTAQAALAEGLPGMGAAQLSFPPALLGHIRQYFAAARCLPYRICEDGSQMDKVVPEELARMFSTFQGDKQEAMNRVLLLARLACLSYGETSLSPSRWAWVKDLENSRLGRVPGTTTTTTTGLRGAGQQAGQETNPLTPDRPARKN